MIQVISSVPSLLVGYLDSQTPPAELVGQEDRVRTDTYREGRERDNLYKAVDNFVCLGVLRKCFASVNKYAVTSDAYGTHCN